MSRVLLKSFRYGPHRNSGVGIPCDELVDGNDIDDIVSGETSLTSLIPKETKGKIMNYRDSITIAAQHAQDWDVPEELLILPISNEAAML